MNGLDDEGHRRLRELLGAYVLGGLPSELAAGLQAHLDGCAACRSELAELAPLADDLRGVDADALSDLPVPPADLGDRIRARIAEEREVAQVRARREQRRRATQQTTRRLLAVAAAVAVLAAAVGAGTALGRSTAPQVVAGPPARLVEQVELRPLDQQLEVMPAKIIAHTWGVEATFVGAGFVQGEVYRAAFRSTAGELVPAGEFLGTGAEELKCNMQSALLRADTAGFVVLDADGVEVLAVDL